MINRIAPFLARGTAQPGPVLGEPEIRKLIAAELRRSARRDPSADAVAQQLAIMQAPQAPRSPFADAVAILRAHAPARGE